MRAGLFLAIPILLVSLFSIPASARMFVYISCADDAEIAALEMNPATGDLKLIQKAKAGKLVMPMAVSPDRRFLYAAIRSVPLSAASYAIDWKTGELVHLSTVPLADNMAYISTDRAGRFLFAASYAGHKISVNPIGVKGLVQGDPTQVLMTGRHAHSILPDPSNRFVYVPNLGSDQIMQFIFDEKTGLLTPNKPGAVHTKVGAGPRHIEFSPNNRFVYVLNELDGNVNAYAMDSQTGLLTEIQSISAVPRNAKLVQGTPAGAIGSPQQSKEPPKDIIKCADLHISPDGNFLYASERTTGTIGAFAVDSMTGKLRYINSYESEKQDRGFNIDPRGNFLIVAGQESGQCSVHKIDRKTGELQLLKRYPIGKDPNWVEIVELP